MGLAIGRPACLSEDYMRARVPVLLIVVCLMTALLAAQDRGVIVITVTDEARAVLPGVTVRVSGPDQRTAISNERGQATFVGLLPGTYQVTVELTGFSTRVVPVAVTAGATERVVVTMAIAALTESVT